jgi:hypothetical protein
VFEVENSDAEPKINNNKHFYWMAGFCMHNVRFNLISVISISWPIALFWMVYMSQLGGVKNGNNPNPLYLIVVLRERVCD